MSESPPPKRTGRPLGSRDKLPRKNPQNVVGAPVTLAPTWELQKEQVWHKHAVYLLAAGKTVQAIALQLGKSYATIQNLTRQPWFKRRVDDLVAELGMDVLDALKALQHKAVSALERIIDDPRSTPAAVVSAADSILDRVRGKPTVYIESSVVHSEDPYAEYQRIEAEIQQLSREKEERRLLPHSSGNGEKSMGEVNER